MHLRGAADFRFGPDSPAGLPYGLSRQGVAMQPEDIKGLIEAGLAGCRAEVTGDGTHFEAVVVCEAFQGKRLLEQHRMVYGTLGNRMHSDIHALSLRTYTPAEWAASAENRPE